MALYYFGNHPHAKRADGTKINTRAHYDYICRQGLYANMKGKKEDLVFSPAPGTCRTGHRMPVNSGMLPKRTAVSKAGHTVKSAWACRKN